MTMVSALQKALNSYDPYGFMQVSAAQASFVTVGLFLINFAFALPNFTDVFILPAFGLIIIATERDFDRRIIQFIIFCLLSIIYGILLTIVHEYRYFVVITVGIVIFSYYMLSKKLDYLKFMIPFIQAVAYTHYIIPHGGNWSQLMVLIINNIAILACAVGLLCLFPRIYFFRIWLRALQYTLKEFETNISAFNSKQLDINQTITKHLLEMQDFSYALGKKAHGFSAQKIALRCMSIYVFFIAVINQVQPVTKHELQELSHVFSRLYHVISINKTLEHIQFVPTENEQLLKIHRKLLGIIREWNRLCQSI